MISYLIFSGTIAGFYALLSLGLVMAWGQGGLVNLRPRRVRRAGRLHVGAAVGRGRTNLARLDRGRRAVRGGRRGTLLVVRNLRGDYLAIVTLGFAEILRLAETNEKWLTKGSDGISGIVAPFKGYLGDSFPCSISSLPGRSSA